MNPVNPDDHVQQIAADLDRFEHLPDELLWQITTRHGACMRPNQRPEPTGDELTDRELAARICAGCPVQRECLELQLRTCGDHTLGVWGALPAQDVRALHPVWLARRHSRDSERGERGERDRDGGQR